MAAARRREEKALKEVAEAREARAEKTARLRALRQGKAAADGRAGEPAKAPASATIRKKSGLPQARRGLF
jgi:hypothetical protein